MRDYLDVLLQGRQFKLIKTKAFKSIRDRYGIKQTEIEVLGYLSSLSNNTSSDVYHDLILNKGHVSQSTIRLRNMGYLTIHQHPTDTRSCIFSLTDKGRSVADEIANVRHSVFLSLLKGFTKQQQSQLEKLAEKICQNMDELENQSL